MGIGKRLIFDQDGEIVADMGEMIGGVATRKENIQLDYIDLDYGQIDFTKFKIISVNTETRQPILEEIPQQYDPYKVIVDLENQLLLASGVI